MSDRSAKAEEILDAAEQMARTGGYNGFSFREIAKRVGIKAASVHYHFPGKDDLGATLAKRYTDRFLDALGDPHDAGIPPETLLRRYVQAYRSALVDDGLMCLCGMLGAEIAYLPDIVAAEARRFFERNIDWLVRVLARMPDIVPADRSRTAALSMIAALEGAMILARTLGNQGIFDDVAEDIFPQPQR